MLVVRTANARAGLFVYPEGRIDDHQFKNNEHLMPRLSSIFSNENINDTNLMRV